MDNPYRKLLSWVGLALIAAFQVWLTVNYKEVAKARSWLVWVGVALFLGTCVLGAANPGLLALMWQECQSHWVIAAVSLPVLGLCIPLQRFLNELANAAAKVRGMEAQFDQFRRELGDAVAKTESAKREIEQQMTHLLLGLPFGISRAFELLHGNDDTRLKLLQGYLLPVVRDLTEQGAQASEVTDADIIRILPVMSEAFMSNTPALVDCVAQVRGLLYKLKEDDFSQTRRVLQTTAEQRLGNQQEQVDAVHVKAYDEIVGHAERWTIQDLSERLCPRLREVGSSPLFADMHLAGKDVPDTFGSKITDPAERRATKDAKEHHRVWKRIEYQEGTIRCWIRGAADWCQEGTLRDISLCGCYCSTCKLEESAIVERVEICLPTNGARRSFNFHGRLRPHSNHFRRNGQRSVYSGFGIQLLDLEDTDDGDRHDDWANIVAQGQEI